MDQLKVHLWNSDVVDGTASKFWSPEQRDQAAEVTSADRWLCDWQRFVSDVCTVYI